MTQAPRWTQSSTCVTDALKRRDSITFTGFGKFSTRDRAAREGVNPRNPSQKVHIPAATVPKFSAGSQLKAAVKGGSAPAVSSEQLEGRAA